MTITERDMVKELTEICKLVISAAAKQTIASHAGADRMTINRKAVGRLHNAARRARAILPPEIVTAVETAAAEGVEKNGC